MSTTGSVIPAETPTDHVLTAKVLTAQGIMARHQINLKEFNKIKQELGQMKLSDILISYPDGPRYDIALYMVATSR